MLAVIAFDCCHSRFINFATVFGPLFLFVIVSGHGFSLFLNVFGFFKLFLNHRVKLFDIIFISLLVFMVCDTFLLVLITGRHRLDDNATSLMMIGLYNFLLCIIVFIVCDCL